MLRENGDLIYKVMRIQSACKKRKWNFVYRSPGVGLRFGPLNKSVTEYTFSSIEEAFAYLMGYEHGESFGKSNSR